MMDLFFKPSFKSGYYTPPVPTTDATDANYNIFSNSKTNYTGYTIVPNFDCVLNSVVKQTYGNITKCYLYDNSGNLLTSASFVSHTATFTPYNLTAGVTYRILVGSDGASYDGMQTYEPISYPIVKTNINYTGGYDSKYSNRGYNIVSVTTSK